MAFFLAKLGICSDEVFGLMSLLLKRTLFERRLLDLLLYLVDHHSTDLECRHVSRELEAVYPEYFEVGAGGVEVPEDGLELPLQRRQHQRRQQRGRGHQHERVQALRALGRELME